VKTGVQCFCDPLKSLDSGFHRNDDSWAFLTFEEFVNIDFRRDNPWGDEDEKWEQAESTSKY